MAKVNPSYHKASISGDELELSMFTQSVEKEKKHYTFDNILFVSVLQGQKNIAVSEDSMISLKKGEVLLCSKPFEAIVECPGASLENPNLCITVEISKDKCKETLDRFNYNLGADKLDIPAMNMENVIHYKGAFRGSLTSEINYLSNVMSENFQFQIPVIENSVNNLLLRSLQIANWKELLLNGMERSTNNPLVEVITYIKNNIHNKITLDLIGKRVGLSRATLCRHFKNYYGIGVNQYIMNTRIAKAKKLLIEDCTSISEVGYACGFASPSYFSRCFEVTTGYTPSSYRQNLTT